MPAVDGDELHPIDFATSHERSPYELAELADEVKNLPVLLKTLPPDRRDLVTQRFIEEREFAEMPEARGTTTRNVREIVAKSLEWMRQAANGE